MTEDSVGDSIPIHYLYDKKGSQLYEQIIASGDYYLYQTEKAILSSSAESICKLFEPGSILLEVGCGLAEKILPVVKEGQQHHYRFLANDISAEFLKDTKNLYSDSGLDIQTLELNIYKDCQVVRKLYPNQPIVLFWLGSSVCNYPLSEGMSILRNLVQAIRPHQVVLGCDLWSPSKTESLLRAYDNTVTREFITNGYHNFCRDKGLPIPLDDTYQVRVNPSERRVEMGLVVKNTFRPVEYSYRHTQEQLEKAWSNQGLYLAKTYEDPTYNYKVFVFDTVAGITPQRFWKISQRCEDTYLDASYLCQNITNITPTFTSRPTYLKPQQEQRIADLLLGTWKNLFPTSLTSQLAEKKSLTCETFFFHKCTYGIASILESLDTTSCRHKKGVVVRMIPDYRICRQSMSLRNLTFLDLPHHLSLTQLRNILNKHESQIVGIITNYPSAPLASYPSVQNLHILREFARRSKALWILDTLLLPTVRKTPNNDWFSEVPTDTNLCVVGGYSKLGLEAISPSFIQVNDPHGDYSDFRTALATSLYPQRFTAHEASVVEVDFTHRDWKHTLAELHQQNQRSRVQAHQLARHFGIPLTTEDGICGWVDLSNWLTVPYTQKQMYQQLFRNHGILVTPASALGEVDSARFRIRINLDFLKLHKLFTALNLTLSSLNSNFTTDYWCTRLRQTGEITSGIFGLVDPKRLLDKPITERHHYRFYQGHIPAFLWIILQRAWGLESLHTDYETLFERGIDPCLRTGEVHCNSVDKVSQSGKTISYPSLSEITDYDQLVRIQVGKVLHRIFTDKYTRCETKPVILSLEHEWMHQETLQYMLQNTPLEWLTTKRFAEVYAQLPRLQPPLQEIQVSWVKLPQMIIYQGRNTLSDNHFTCGWDNEYSDGYREMPVSWVSKYPVTYAQYAVFVQDGGYQTECFWRLDHWKWIQSTGREKPQHWHRKGDDYHIRLPLRMVSLKQVANHPVSVSLAEAQAYCQWYQKKHDIALPVTVPTEDQWLQAIESTSTHLPPLYHHLDQSHIGQIGHIMETREMVPNHLLASSRGVSHLIGNAWELTSTPHHQFTGFIPEQLYPDYSRDFFSGTHYVCKGASWATARDMVRPSFRNFYQDLYTYHITQFRLSCIDPQGDSR